MSAAAGVPGDPLDIVSLIGDSKPRGLTHLENYYMNSISDILDAYAQGRSADDQITPEEVAHMSVHMVSLSRAMIGVPGPFKWGNLGAFISSPTLALDLTALSYNENMWNEAIEYMPSLEVVVPGGGHLKDSHRFSRIRALIAFQQSGALDPMLIPTKISGSAFMRVLSEWLISGVHELNDDALKWWMYASYPPWVYAKAYKDKRSPDGSQTVSIGPETVKEFIGGVTQEITDVDFEFGQKEALGAALRIANTEHRPYDIIADIIFDPEVIREVIPKTGTTGTTQRIIPTEMLDALSSISDKRRSYTIGWDGIGSTDQSNAMIIRFLVLSVALLDSDSLASKTTEWTNEVLKMERRMIKSVGLNRSLARSMAIQRIQSMKRIIRFAVDKADEISRTSASVNWTEFPEKSPWIDGIRWGTMLNRGSHPCDSTPTATVKESLPSRDASDLLGERDDEATGDILEEFTGELPEAVGLGDSITNDRVAIAKARAIVGLAYGIDPDTIGGKHPPSPPSLASVSGDRVGTYLAFTANTHMKDVGGLDFERVTYVLFNAEGSHSDMKDMVAASASVRSPVPLHFGYNMPVPVMALTWTLDMFLRGMNTVRIEWWLSLLWFDYKHWGYMGTGSTIKSFAFDWVLKRYASKIIG